MGIDPKQLHDFIIVPTLEEMGLYSPQAAALLLGTAAQESLCGQYLKQIGGPALGIYQMEPATFEDIFDNFLAYREDLRGVLRQMFAKDLPISADAMVYNLRLATAMARLHYRRKQEPIPPDVLGLAGYWKRHYNTLAGKGTESEFLANWKRFKLSEVCGI